MSAFFLAEQILIRSQVQVHWYGSQKIPLGHRRHRSVKGSGLLAERLLDCDVRRGSACGKGSDGESLEKLIGVVADEHAVLEGRRFTLRGVASEVGGFLCLEDPLPLGTCGESATPSAPEPRALHDLDDLSGGQRQGLGEGSTSTYGQVIVERGKWL
jgi:hypothetical protein